MDLTELIHREGIERLRAAQAACDSARIAHLGLASGYRGRIDALRADASQAAPAAVA